MSIDRTKLRWNGWGWAATKDALAGRDDIWKWLAEELGMPALLATPARPLDEIGLPEPRLAARDIAALGDIVGTDRVKTDKYERAFHARGRSYHDLLLLRAGTIDAAPDAVLYPRGAEEVQALLALCDREGIAVVPYGGGTSVVGGAGAVRGDHRGLIAIDLSGMSRMIATDPVSLTATAEAGIYGPALESALRAQGMTLGHHPQSFEFSTLGGWIAHRGAGQQSHRYGKAESWLLSARLATPRGALATEEFPASAAGPRLTDLVLGSEGAFGIVTEATFRIRRAPKLSDYRGFLFRDFASGTAAIREAAQEEIPAAMLRLSDGDETRFYRAFSRLGHARRVADYLERAYLRLRRFPDAPCALIAGFEGDEEIVRDARRRFARIAARLGALALGQKPGQRWYRGRFHGPYSRDPMMDHGTGVDTLETAARWSRIDALYAAVKGALETAIVDTAPRTGAKGVVLCHISHAYPDGASLYFTYIFPRALDREVEQWREIKRRASDAIVAHGGTISHHHGVGEDHLAWMEAEKGTLGLDVLRAIKKTLDPNGIMNPGKLIPN